ncbi:hypothetical protein SAMN05443248_7667 [Bradyrhizobium erythrophlei]|uniref:Uncharacterized protein n=1 Tax=Bradyrhizobium erythrophlei TaxID=1437360 RepID=A0A1M5XVT1_9BRAD|nr:hypothetical protein SAMN05443248_7667 [Bradyrhizobium erythrophlei]
MANPRRQYRKVCGKDEYQRRPEASPATERTEDQQWDDIGASLHHCDECAEPRRRRASRPRS